MKRKGVSPVIATLLLVAIVMVIALLVFLWFKSFAQEAVVKFDQNVEIVCDEVIFSGDFYGTKLEISNDGNIPIEDFKLKWIDENGEYSTETLSEKYSYTDVGETRVRQGKTETFDLANHPDSSKLIVIPILRGISDSGEKNVPCEERYGIEVIL
jgi:flagellin-like protein